MAEQSVAIKWQGRGEGGLKDADLIEKLLTVESGVAGWAMQGRNTELWGIPLVGGGGVREMASRPRHNQDRRILSDRIYKARSNKRRQPALSKPGFSMHCVVKGCKHWWGVH